MPGRFSALAFVMLAASFLAPATVVACGQGEDGTQPSVSGYSEPDYHRENRIRSAQELDDYNGPRFDGGPRNFNGGYPEDNGDYGQGYGRGRRGGGRFRGFQEQMGAGPGGYPGDGMSDMPGGRFRGLNPGIYSRMGRASISPRLSGQSADDYLSAMINDEGIGRWAPERFPLKVYFAPGRNVPGYRPSFKAQMMDAFNEWVTVSNGKLAWKEVSTPGEADIYCQWTSEVNKQRPNEAGYTVAMARNNDRTPIRTMGKAKVTILTHFNGKILSDKDMRKVCLHELGHAYGLQGHSPFSDDIMFATTSPYQGERLSQRDVKSIQSLYSGYSIPSTIGAIGDANRGYNDRPYMN